MSPLRGTSGQRGGLAGSGPVNILGLPGCPAGDVPKSRALTGVLVPSAAAAEGSFTGAPGVASESKPPDVWTSGEAPARPGVVQAGEAALALRGPDSGSSIMDAQACIIALDMAGDANRAQRTDCYRSTRRNSSNTISEGLCRRTWLLYGPKNGAQRVQQQQHKQ